MAYRGQGSAPRGASSQPVPDCRVSPQRCSSQTPTRREALRLYTQGSAWFAHDDARRGALAIGQLADLAVLTHDYLAVPVDEIGRIRSLLTMVGGRVVYAAEPYAGFEARGTPVE
jgi:predicted amidohydrolase YtcJ